jgi:hypothetical protein
MLRKWLSLGVLVVLASALGWLAWMNWGTLGAPRAELAGRYKTEEQWIAGEIARDLAEMAAHAGGRRADDRSLAFSIEAPSPGGVRVSFTLGDAGPASHEIRWGDHVWAPDTYEDVARGALTAVGRNPTPASPSESEATLTELLTPTAGVMETANQRISGRLAESMLDPEAHEDAALLVGALALREASGPFWDVRQLLCRMTAHLAFARAVRGSSTAGLSGRYAALVLARLAGRTADAMKGIESLEVAAPASETQKAWLRALRLSVTEDWRRKPEAPGGPLLERLQAMRAIRRSVGDAAAVAFAEGGASEDVPDWGRIALDGDFGIAVGGFVSQETEPEVEEARELYERVHGKVLTEGKLVDALNQPAQRCVTPEGPRVLGWGTWAASLQRHVCHRVVVNDQYVRKTQGRQREGLTRMRAFDARWSSLALYPFVEATRWKTGRLHLEAFLGGIRTGVKTAARTPERVNDMTWTFMSEVTDVAVTRRRMPDFAAWFSVPVPEGTAYRAGERMYAMRARADNPELVDALLRRDPWSFELGYRVLAIRHPKRVPLEDVHRIAGPREDYDMRVLSLVATDADPGSPERIAALEKMCALQSDRCLPLAHQYVAERRDDDAAEAFRRAFASGNDPVLASNNSRFLVLYLHQKGKEDEATEVARSAAETYSARGLHTMALLHEWRDRLQEAETLHRQIESQYDHRDTLFGFLYRVKQRDPTYEPRFAALLKEYFPAGLEKVDPSTLPSPPQDGVRISRLDGLARSFGLEESDVVVGVDGWRVRNEAQFGAAMSLDWRPEVVLRRWRGGSYADVAARISPRRFEIHYDTYPRAERDAHAHIR